ncbi:hypothetical protein Pla52o_56600 [Novipirellula galeiformis]|uniref:Uncharacterized protein n=1 Tax=Novipirellula galeiformis TaxID=2528004 RepID=A0A5C6BEA8_9BACT|nr:hypothetical protein [Novipirellula galeiformis]TWU10378.1 hypothetical protein Pla52o_56600 [Novipirellula galeiformis]
MSNPSESDRRKPTLRAALVSPTAISNLVASLSLVACVMLPHSVGCNDESLRPIEIMGAEAAEGRPLITLTFFWPYVFGLGTFLLFIALVVVRPRQIERFLIALPIGFSLYLFAIWLLLLFSSTSESRVAMVCAAIVIPSATLVGIRMTWFWMEGQKVAAATWAQTYLSVLAIFSLRWFWMMPIKRLLYGGVLSMIAVTMIMIASWTWTSWAKHDLADENHPAEPFQLSLQQIIFGILFIAIAMTYWRFMEAQ